MAIRRNRAAVEFEFAKQQEKNGERERENESELGRADRIGGPSVPLQAKNRGSSR